jgi:site-specific recombinase XerC
VDGRVNRLRIHKALGTYDWSTAVQIVRDWEAGSTRLEAAKNESEPMGLNGAWERFLTSLESRKLQQSTIRKYRLLERQMMHFAEQHNIKLLVECDLDFLDSFRATWKDGALSSCKKLERLKAFFKFAYQRKWISSNPVLELRAPKVRLRPTMPFDASEMQRILDATDRYLAKAAANGRENARRIRALVLVLRYSGIRISDAYTGTPVFWQYRKSRSSDMRSLDRFTV